MRSRVEHRTVLADRMKRIVSERYLSIVLRTIALAFLTMLASRPAAQTTYYVDDIGNDASDGLSIIDAWRTIQKAFDTAGPGDTVMILSGTYNENPVLNVSGLPGQPIIFRNYPGNSPGITGDPTEGPFVTIVDKSHIVFRGIRIQGYTGPDAQGLLIKATPNGGVNDVLFNRCTIRYIAWTLDPLQVPGPDDNARPIVIRGEGFAQANAISGLVIDSLNIYDNLTGSSPVISVDGNVDGFVIQHSYIHDNSNTGLYLGGHHGVSSNASLDNVRNGRVMDNDIWYNLDATRTSAGIDTAGADDIIIERNECHANGAGIRIGVDSIGVAVNNTVRDNLIHQNLLSGLVLGSSDPDTGEALNTLVRNNTFFRNDLDTTSAGEFLLARASFSVITNNLFVTNDQHALFTRLTVTPQLGNFADHNAWSVPGNDPATTVAHWGTDTIVGFAAYQAASAWDAGGLFGDPLLVDANILVPDLRLQPGSPCIDAGDPFTAIPLDETDFSGSQRIVGAHIDIGAYEFDPTASVFDATARDAVPFPNPCGDRLFFDPPWQVHAVEVTDIHGRLLLHEQLPGSSINLRRMPEGTLLIRFQHADGSWSVARVVRIADL